ncbi:MAG: DNA polymerase III subunit beta [Acholeplasmataceae bacterium]|jgi:DNA polymerase-3 subunit beta|nr:DNA polymerase III subunit beta [Acholeplasmataceae bacterium]MDD4203571.1 DNA polymerase III subunit beta [Acholeplasmataceae bacterium]MDD4468313.1 DNA polymerase III subunit beta [Acholeplasmataceae bacterium]MDD4824407.1 DNA polymerase III subunit beta [Acholeplasmataceae bacterium]MDY0316646.1 DNA polymerase III subunit beta [Acholeplasmatales bacterium]
MIFSINQDLLLDTINVIQRGLPVKTPLPILNGIKLEVFDDHLIFTTSNTDIAIQMIVNDSSLEVLSPGRVVIPGKYLIDITRKLEGRVEFSLVENRVLVIRSSNVEYKLHVMDVEDYPDVDFLDMGQPIVLESKTLKGIIKETNYATSQYEKRPILTGVNFKHEEDKLFCVATDSYRLSQKILPLSTDFEPFNIVIPNKSLDELSRIIDSVNEDVEIYISPNKVLFKFNDILFQTRLLDGVYPDTLRIIPTEFPIIIKFNKDELLRSVERVSLLSPKDRENNYNIIKLMVKKDYSVEISSTNTEIGDAQEVIIPTDDVVGPAIKIAFSSKYLTEALKAFTSNEVTLNFAGEIKPFVLKGDLDPDMLSLILPVRIE